MAFNTPFKMWKRYEFNGGTSDPCVIAYPKGIKARGELRDQYYHAVDVMPTILDVLGVDPPETISGHTQSRSMVSACAGASTMRGRVCAKDPVLLDAGIAVDLARRLEGRHDSPGDRRLGGLQQRHLGALPHRHRPRSRTTSSSEQPEKVRELVNLWFAEAGANEGFPLDDRTVIEIANTPRPQLSAPRDRYVYFPGDAPVGEWQAVNCGTGRL